MFSTKKISLNIIEKLNAARKVCGEIIRYEDMKVAIIGAGISAFHCKKLSKKQWLRNDIYEARQSGGESHPLIGNSKIKCLFLRQWSAFHNGAYTNFMNAR
ncbi:MAG: hypothetical protein CM15mP58_19910 [Burkholderiaceae bacterium]|nr:MAG: hypothetical protein CM15mP58_19910 [Burkholderiaceae bacterium]